MFENINFREFLTVKNYKILICALGYVFFGLFNNVGVLMMGYRMEPYPLFLLWGTTLAYTAIFAVIAKVKNERWLGKSREEMKIIISLGIFTSVNGVLAQFAVPHIDPELQNLIVQVSIPITWISAKYMFKEKTFNWGHYLAFFTIISGLLLGILPSFVTSRNDPSLKQYDNSFFWIMTAFISAIPTSFETTFQERAYRVLKMDKFVTLTYYNLISLIVYLLSMPLEMTNTFGSGLTWNQMWVNQGLAVQCFFGDKSIDGCQSGATFWVLAFTFGYVGMFSLGAFLLQNKDSYLVANLNAFLVPLAAIFFWIKPFVQQNAERYSGFVLGAVLLLLFANLFYEYSDKIESERTNPEIEFSDTPESYQNRPSSSLNAHRPLMFKQGNSDDLFV